MILQDFSERFWSTLSTKPLMKFAKSAIYFIILTRTFMSALVCVIRVDVTVPCVLFLVYELHSRFVCD